MMSTMNLALLGGVAALLVVLLVMRRSTPDGASSPKKSGGRRSDKKVTSTTTTGTDSGRSGAVLKSRRSKGRAKASRAAASDGGRFGSLTSRLKRGKDDGALAAAEMAAAAVAEAEETFTGAPVEGEPDWDAIRAEMNGEVEDVPHAEAEAATEVAPVAVAPAAAMPPPDTSQWEDEEIITEPGWPLPGDIDASFDEDEEAAMNLADEALTAAREQAEEEAEAAASQATGVDGWLGGAQEPAAGEAETTEPGLDVEDELVWDDTPPAPPSAIGDAAAEAFTEEWTMPGAGDDADGVALDDALAIGAGHEDEGFDFGGPSAEPDPVEPFDFGSLDAGADDEVIDPTRDEPDHHSVVPQDLSPELAAGEALAAEGIGASTDWEAFEAAFVAQPTGEADAGEDAAPVSDDAGFPAFDGTSEEDVEATTLDLEDVPESAAPEADVEADESGWTEPVDEAAATAAPVSTEVSFPADADVEAQVDQEPPASFAWSDESDEIPVSDPLPAWASNQDEEPASDPTVPFSVASHPAWDDDANDHHATDSDRGDAVAPEPAADPRDAWFAPAAAEDATPEPAAEIEPDEAADRAWTAANDDEPADPWSLATSADSVEAIEVEAAAPAESDPVEAIAATRVDDARVLEEFAAAGVTASTVSGEVTIPSVREDGGEVAWWDEPTDLEVPTRVGVIPDWMRAPTDERLTGRWSLGGMAFQAGHQALSTVSFRKPLETAPQNWTLAAQGRPLSGTIVLLVEATMNCVIEDLHVVTGEGFAPTEDGFTVTLSSSSSGPFAASGTFRIVP